MDLEVFEKIDAETGSSSSIMDFKLLLLLVLVAFSVAVIVAISSGGALRNLVISGIKGMILKPLLVCIYVFEISCTLLYLVAWSFRLVYLLSRLVLQHVPKEGLLQRLDIWVDEFEAADSSNPDTVAAQSNEFISLPKTHHH